MFAHTSGEVWVAKLRTEVALRMFLAFVFLDLILLDRLGRWQEEQREGVMALEAEWVKQKKKLRDAPRMKRGWR